MPTGLPFFRGYNRVDAFTGALVLARLYQLDYPGVVEAFSLVAPAQFQFSVPVTEAIPAFSCIASPDYVVIAITGTQTNTQQILNVVGSAQAAIDGVPGLVGLYWGAAAVAVYENIKARLDALLPERRVVILAHSLGGAIGDILLALIKRDHPSQEIACQTYGCPRPGDPTFAAAISPFVIRFEDVGDPIIALPPEVWSGPGSHWPVPGPPPFDAFAAVGNPFTVDALGNISNTSNPMGTVTAAYTIAILGVQPHYVGEYARRLRIGIPPEDLAPPVSLYVKPSGLDPTLQFVLGDDDMTAGIATPTTYYNVRVFYQYGESGPTEDFSTPTAPSVIRSTLMGVYLKARMGLAVNTFGFNYARITNPAQPRWVDFITPDVPGLTLQGQLAPSLKEPSFGIGAGDQAALLLRLKIASGPSARIFLHGFDQSMDNEGTFTPNGAWKQNFPKFLAMLKNGDNKIFFQYATPVGLAGRLAITAIAAQPVRGAKITPAAATAVTPGTVVYIGGVGRSMVGVKGRKIVQSVAPDNSFFIVGGASPVGSYTPPGAYYYAVAPNFGSVDYASVERLTSHKVGKVFGQPVGKKSALLSLRL